MLAAVAAIATLVFIVVASAVGARLVWLSRQTRGLPEFALGFGLMIIVGLGYPLALVGRGGVTSSPDVARWCLALSAVPMSLGWFGVWIFTWRVFRPDALWARALTFSALVAMVGFCIASIRTSLGAADPSTIDFGSPVYTGVSFLAMTANVWAATESWLYYGKMRKRVAVGLGDPVVANRFLLWTWVMLTSIVSTGVPTTASMLGINSVASPPVLFASAIAGLLCSTSLWLAFLPPQAYLARIRATA